VSDPQPTDAKDLIRRGDYLFGQRSDLLNLWQEIADNFFPFRADFTYRRSIGDEFAGHLTSSYPIMVHRELGNAFAAMLRPRDQPWFGISVEQEDRLDRSGREWLEWASGVQRRAMYDRRTQFVRATKEGDNDFAAFGQCVISRETDHRERSLLYRCWHLKDVAWAEKHNGTTPETHRKWRPTCQELAKLFRDRCHTDIKKRLEKEPFSTVECRHIILPTEDYNAPGGGQKWKTPYVSIHVDVEHNLIMEETGSWSQVYTKPRWQTVSGSQYAYSPAAVAGLPDARLLQAMTLTLLEAGEMALRPPMIGVKDALRSDLQLFAGGFTAVDAEYDERLGEVLRPIAQDKTGIPFGLEITRDTRETLSAAFYLNKLTLPPADREMTAFETGQRIQEYIRSALPLFEPMESEYNGALCEDTFEELLRLGAFGRPDDIPESIRGAEIQFRFESPLHEAIERKKGTKFLEAKQLIREAIELDPSTLPTMDARKALRDALEGIGTPSKWLRDERDVEAFAKQQQAQQQAEQLTSQVANAAEAGKSLGEATQVLNAAA
jgi:head-to-tail connecting protein